MKSELLIIFTKNPILGKVKTRLAKTLGSEKALHVFQNLLKHIAKTLIEWGGDVWIFYSDFIPENDLWSPIGNQLFLQEGDGLGTRMSHAFKNGFQEYQKVVLMGTDIPEISVDIIKTAFNQLTNYDFVFGPTFDGGYYLVGMNQPHHFLFENITWSTDQVLAQTLEQINHHHYSVGVIEMLTDIDYEADLEGFDWLIV